MSEKQHSHVPYGADGSGYYTENAQGCFICIKEATSLMMEALGIPGMREELSRWLNKRRIMYFQYTS